MPVPAEAPRPFAPLFRTERSRLLDLLHSLEPADWSRTTACPGWDVLDLTAHLVGVDFSLLSWHRDGHHATMSPPDQDEEEFIAWIDDLQAEWVRAARRLSPRLVTEILQWTDTPVVELIQRQDPEAATAHVSWAGDTPVPVWVDQGRELSERWIHRQQLIEAVGGSSDLRVDVAFPVLDTLRWAYPYRLGECRRPAGSIASIVVDGPELHETWRLRSDGVGWHYSTDDGELVAQVELTSEQAWRLLTNNYRPDEHGYVEASGDPEILDVVRRTRAIIGTPK